MNRRVLVIGPDLEFVFWVCRALDQSGCEAFPARSVEAAAETVSEFHVSPNLVILTAHLPDAANLIASLRQAQENLRVVRLAGLGEEDGMTVDGVHPRPADRTEKAKAELLKVVCHAWERQPISH